ncbi:hypothetical protein [Dactylosporangium sp. CA-233914]|uniref:hypothetical protein n=1 Tax=Dactylosporangium sp. CA-233914 TaxID=3239934 RepID=UPI003D9383D1
MGFEWMPGLQAFLRDVDPDEVREALDYPRRWPRPVRGPQGLTYIAIHSRTRAGRAVTVVVRHLGGHDAVIVGARTMSADDVALFKEWEQDHE